MLIIYDNDKVLLFFSLDKNSVICTPNTILMLWQNDCGIVRNLNESQILSKINDENSLNLYVI